MSRRPNRPVSRLSPWIGGPIREGGLPTTEAPPPFPPLLGAELDLLLGDFEGLLTDDLIRWRTTRGLTGGAASFAVASLAGKGRLIYRGAFFLDTEAGRTTEEAYTVLAKRDLTLEANDDVESTLESPGVFVHLSSARALVLWDGTIVGYLGEGVRKRATSY